MFYKEAKNTLTEIDEIYKDFVIEIATKVSTKVKGKIFYGYANIEDMWYIIIKTRELGEKRFFLNALTRDMMNGISSKEISNNIVKLYHDIIKRRFFII